MTGSCARGGGLLLAALVALVAAPLMIASAAPGPQVAQSNSQAEVQAEVQSDIRSGEPIRLVPLKPLDRPLDQDKAKVEPSTAPAVTPPTKPRISVPLAFPSRAPLPGLAPVAPKFKGLPARRRERVEKRTAPSPVPTPAPSPDAGTAPGAAKGAALGTTRGSLGASSIVVDTLPDLNPDSVGVLDETRGGLGADMWRGTGRERLDGLLRQLPAAPRSLTLRDLMRRLLLSNATAPGGNTGGDTGGDSGRGSLLALRLERLLAMGELDGVRDLLQAGGTRDSTRDSAGVAVRAEVELLLLAGDLKGACETVLRRIAEYESTLLTKILVFCQALAGEHDRAALGLGLMREEQSEQDPAFVLLIDAMGGDEEARVESLPEPSPLVLAMMGAAGQELPLDTAGATAPTVLRAIAASDNAPDSVRLEVAERAGALGVVPVATVARAYGDIAFVAADFERTGQIGPADYGLEARALLYQAMRRQMDPVERGRLLQRSWHLADRFGVYPLTARVTAPVLLGVPPTPELAWFAPDAARALFTAGQRDQAMAWYDMMRKRAGGNSVIVAALWPLAQLSGGEVVWDAVALQSWAFTQRRLHGPDAESRIALLYALFSGLGVGGNVEGEFASQGDASASAAEAGRNVPGRMEDWALLVPQTVLTAVDAVPEAWADTRAAAADGRRGETVALILVGVGTGELTGITPAGWRVVIAALRTVGLEAEARALALEAAVAAGL